MRKGMASLRAMLSFSVYGSSQKSIVENNDGLCEYKKWLVLKPVT